MKALFFTSIFFLLLGSSCKDPSKGQKDVKNIATNLILGHRGAGANVEEGRIENTLTSITYGLQKLDGCEIDVQMSSDGTIWVYHDALLGNFCDSLSHNTCVPLSSDHYLNQLRQCRAGVEDSLCTLEEVFQIIDQAQFRDKVISLDVKGYFDEACFEGANATEDYFDAMVDHLKDLLEKYHIVNQLVVETDYTYFLDVVQEEIPALRCHLLAYANFSERLEKAMDNGYDGLSCSLGDTTITWSKLNHAREKGMEVQLWTIGDSTSLSKAKELEPFAIQIDHPSLVE